jgi:nicotinamidase-related amidase
MAALSRIGPGAVHVVVDMQRMFAEPGSWYVKDLPLIVPNILALAGAMPGRTFFTRYMVPFTAAELPGQWRVFYEHWREFTGAELEPGKEALIDELRALPDASATIDKFTYSAFSVPAFEERLRDAGADTLVFTGVETDVCVLATLLDAVDAGFRVVAVEDAMTSSSGAGHSATLRHVLTRLDKQVDIADTAAVLAARS